MNKIITSLVVFFTLLSGTAQKKAVDSIIGEYKTTYNTWSIEANIGSSKAVRPFTDGYASSGDSKFLNITGINHFDIGVRKMINPKFGLKFDIASDIIENQGSSADSKNFYSTQNRVALQGIINLARVLNFNTFSKRIGLLAHGGVQLGSLTPKPVGGKIRSDRNGGYIIGLTPQVKITDKLVFTSDFSVLVNSRQHSTWNGGENKVSNNLSGEMNVINFGLTCYLGKNAKHEDWIAKNYGFNQEKIIIKQEKVITVIENGIDKVEEFIVNFDINENEPNISNSDHFKKIINLLLFKDNIKVIIYFFEEGNTEDLSIARTNSIKNILVSNNINQERITISKKTAGPLDKNNDKLAKDIKILLYSVK